MKSYLLFLWPGAGLLSLQCVSNGEAAALHSTADACLLVDLPTSTLARLLINVCLSEGNCFCVHRSVFKIRSETCRTEAQFCQNLYMIKKDSLPDRPKFCRSGSAVRHLFWRLTDVPALVVCGVLVVVTMLLADYLKYTYPYCRCHGRLIFNHLTDIIQWCANKSLLRSPELKNLLEFMYLQDKSWNLI